MVLFKYEIGLPVIDPIAKSVWLNKPSKALLVIEAPLTEVDIVLLE